MSTKQEGDSCYNKAAMDEPIFVLRAQDILAPSVVTFWAEEARKAGTPEEKVAEALLLVRQMMEWQDANDRVKVPN